MNLELHKPELVQRLNAQLQSRHFHGVDELIEKALGALDKKNPRQWRRRMGASTSFL
jgi:hypothetical protein